MMRLRASAGVAIIVAAVDGAAATIGTASPARTTFRVARHAASRPSPPPSPPPTATESGPDGFSDGVRDGPACRVRNHHHQSNLSAVAESQ